MGRDLGFSYEIGALVPDGSKPPECENPDRDYVPCARPGARAPHQGIVKEGEIRSILDLFDGRWTLLAAPTRADSWRSAAATAGVPVEFVCVGVDVQDPSGAGRGFAVTVVNSVYEVTINVLRTFGAAESLELSLGASVFVRN